ncbi:MAG: DUF4432 family protein [Caldisericum sp.]|uniref:DUF4432 family protein n=1 Tax=Caldisericum sp. TaxID=2499687 RepID=UPI003D11B8C2
MKIQLKKAYFSNKEELFMQIDDMSVSTFLYETGILSVKLKNSKGYVEILPFNGQMIWDAVFNERTLKMKTSFTAPRNVNSFLDTYGCYLMHCGVLGMGSPGPEDKHPLHGELPYASYDDANVIAGSDEKGTFIGVNGIYEYNRAFGDHYIAKPEIKLYRESTVLDISIAIENLSNYPMEMMYMCHINNRPVVGGKIIQSFPWDPTGMELRQSIPKHIKVSETFEKFLQNIGNDYSLTSIIRKDSMYDPEIVFFLKNPMVDKYGWTHLMQMHPDGSADYTSYKPEELDHASRWIVRTKNMEALGLALPATADAEGYNAEKKKGNIKTIKPMGTFIAHLRAGYLDKNSAQEMAQKIDDLQK